MWIRVMSHTSVHHLKFGLIFENLFLLWLCYLSVAHMKEFGSPSFSVLGDQIAKLWTKYQNILVVSFTSVTECSVQIKADIRLCSTYYM